MNKKKFLNYLATSAILAGAVLGVGVFGVPYAFSKAGFWPGLFFLIAACLLNIWAHLIYGESLSRTPGDLRGPALAKTYLGKTGFWVSFLGWVISAPGIMLAYLILGGQFTQNFLVSLGCPISLVVGVLIFWLVGISGMSLGIKFVGISEIVSLVLIAGLVLVFLLFGLPGFKVVDIHKINFSEFFLPYGILLFALSSISAIPEIFSYFKKNNISPIGVNFKAPIIIGTIIPAVLSLLFVLGIWGMFGAQPVPADPISELAGKNALLAFIANILGIILIITSFFIGGLNIQNTLISDFRISKKIGWLAAAFVPLALYFSGLKNFVSIIGFLGAVVLGVQFILLIAIHHQSQKKGKLKPYYSIRLSLGVKIFLAALLLAGVILGVLRFF